MKGLTSKFPFLVVVADEKEKEKKKQNANCKVTRASFLRLKEEEENGIGL